MEADTTKDELYHRAQELGVEGRSSMSKEELAQALEEQASSQEPPPLRPTGNWLRDHLLSLILFGLFLLSLLGQLYFQYRDEVGQALQHGAPPPELFSGDFWNAFASSVFENWQSEFLQLGSFVLLATYFIHRGSPQSRDGSDEMQADIKAIRSKLGA